MKFDLHTHTNLSTCASPSNTWDVLLDKAEAANVKTLAITDHNTVGFYTSVSGEDIEKHFTGKIIPGIEFSVSVDGIAIELLAYDFDVDIINDWSTNKYGTPRFRQEKIKEELEKLIKEHGIEYDFDAKFEDGVYAHEHVLNNLIKYDSTLDMLESFGVKTRTDFYRISGANKDFPLYLDMDKIWPSVEEVVDVVHRAHGIVVFAHPYNYNEKVDVDATLEKLLTKNIDGIEVYHPSCNDERIDKLNKFAIKHNLIITGGSDYHGVPRHNHIGVSVGTENSLHYWSDNKY